MTDLAQRLATSLATAGLVPGSAAAIVPEGFEPSVRVDVCFPRAVDLGNLFRAGECKAAPQVALAAATTAGAGAAGAADDAGARYLFMMVDPDAPTPDEPKFAFWRHWVVSGMSLAGAAGAAVTAYLGPGPKDESGPHRYMFLVFEEPAGLRLTREDVGGDEFVERRSFDVAGFVGRHGLRLVGMNWMTCVGDGWKGGETGTEQ